MHSTFLRSVILASVCGFIAAILELLHQGVPPLLGGYTPTILYFAQALSLYLAAGSGMGLVSGGLYYLLSHLSRKKLPGRFLRDLIPVGLFLLIYFAVAGGASSRIPLGLDPLPTGALSQRGAYLFLIIFSLSLILGSFIFGKTIQDKPSATRDALRALTAFILILTLCIGLSEKVRFPVAGRDTNWKGPAGNTPVLLFGIDGANWEVMMPLVRADLMPNLSTLMERGVYGNFQTVGAPLSSAVWTDMATGKSRWKHGITGNVVLPEGEYESIPPRSYHRKVPAIWNILSEAGRRVAIANWRVTYPPEEVNGVLASMLIFQGEGKVYPSSLERKIVEITKPQRIMKESLTPKGTPRIGRTSSFRGRLPLRSLY